MSASPRQGNADPYKIKPKYTNRQNKKYILRFVRAQTKPTPAPPLFSAGVRTMRARICSAFSCAMFARVVWLKPWGAQNRRLLLYFVSHALATHYFLRLTRARGGCFLRGRKALLNDFWYFSSRKSTIREKFLHVSSRGVEAPTPTR